MCLHEKRKADCIDCGGSNICPHGRIRRGCKEYICVAEVAARKARRNHAQYQAKSLICYHGKSFSLCKTCCELRRTCIEVNERFAQEMQAKSDDVWVNSFFNPTCPVCSETKPLEHFLNHDKSDALDICNACLTKQQADDEEEEEGIDDSDFGDLDKVIHCLQCRKDLPVAAFPPDVGPDDLAICTECQELIDHTPMQPCARKCGAHARAPRTEGPAFCENCRDIQGILP